MKKILVFFLTVIVLLSMCPAAAFAATKDVSTISVIYKEDGKTTEKTGSWCELGSDKSITGYNVVLKKGTTVFRQDNGIILMNGNISIKTDDAWVNYKFTNGSYSKTSETKISAKTTPGTSISSPSQDGWVAFENGWKYKSSGKYLKNAWLENLYYFDNTGYMVTGKKAIGNYCYYFGTGNDGYDKGVMVANAVISINGSRYYFDKDGAMIKNSIVINEKDGKAYSTNTSGIVTEIKVIYSSF